MAGNISCLYSAIGLVSRPQLPLVTLLNYLWPTFTLLFAISIFKLPVNKARLALGSTIVIAGLALEILSDWTLTTTLARNEYAAFAFALLAAIFWGLFSSLNRLWSTPPLHSVLPWLMGVAAIVLFALAALFPHPFHLSTETYIPLLYLALLPYLANLCWDTGTRLGNLPVLSLLADFIPWLSLTMSAIYLGIAIPSSTLTSALLIVAGAVLSRTAMHTPKR